MGDGPGKQKVSSILLPEAFHSPLFYLAAVTLFFVISAGLELALGNRKVGRLKDVARAAGPDLPGVSLIVAARNEERNIEQALRSLLAQDYPRLEIVVVDDRSTDTTAAILDGMSHEHTRLKIIHLKELPHGWLGKCRALQSGSECASGDWLIFADADIVMEPTVVSRAVAFAIQRKIDHLPIAPVIRLSGFLTNCFAGFFGAVFNAHYKPWKVGDPKSRYFIGIGAFNMIRADVYRRIGRHRPIAMRPDDDVMLGKLVKKNGFRQEILFADDLMSVEWYSSFREMVGGLMKNSFAGAGYSVSFVVLATILQLATSLWPFTALFFTSGTVWLLNAAIVLALLTVAADSAKYFGLKFWAGLAYPIGNLLFLYIIWRATFLTLIHDGIDWRGTHYSLKELKANKV